MFFMIIRRTCSLSFSMLISVYYTYVYCIVFVLILAWCTLHIVCISHAAVFIASLFC